MEIARVAVDASAAPDHSDDRKAVLAGVTVDGAEPSDAEPE